jgi:hypothetical protein
MSAALRSSGPHLALCFRLLVATMKISGGLLALASLASFGARSVLAQSEDPDQVWPIHDNGLNQVVQW